RPNGIALCHGGAVIGPPAERSRPMQVSTIGLDIAKNVFQVHGIGATAIVRYTRRKATAVSIWANRLLERKPARLITVAVANKMAGIAWAVMVRQEAYRAAPTAA